MPDARSLTLTLTNTNTLTLTLTLTLGFVDVATAESNALFSSITSSRGGMGTLQVSSDVLMAFRQCVDGEYLESQDCIVCGSEHRHYHGYKGEYSLHYESNPPTESCKVCPDEAIDCMGTTIELYEGYWRLAGNDIIYECPKGGACSGGLGVGDELCAEGHEGPMCDVCSANYFASDSKCIPCEDAALSTGAIAAYSVFGIIGLVAAAWMYYALVIKKAEKEVESQEKLVAKGASAEIEEEETGKSQFEKIAEYVKVRSFQILTRVKILTSTYQVITSASVSFKITYPQCFVDFVDEFNWLNFDFTSAFPFACTYDKFNFTLELITTTLTPPVLIMMLFVTKRVTRARTLMILYPIPDTLTRYHNRSWNSCSA